MIVRVRSVESRAIPISHRLELRELRLHVVRRAADFSFELATCAAAMATGLSRRMNRIEEGFARLKGEGKKGFIVYIGAGDPNLEATRQLAP